MPHSDSPVLLARFRRSLGVALAAVLAASAGFEVAPSQAQGVDHDHVIDLVERQGMLVEKMSKESILIALEVDSENRLAALRGSQELFSGVQAGLREGDPGLGLAATTNPKTLDKLSVVEGLWPLFDGAIRTALETGAVGRGQIDTLTELNQPLIEALGRAADAYQADAAGHQLHSMLGQVISTARGQRLLSQRMAKEFFLIAYRHEADKNRFRLKKSTDQFDQAMNALLEGSTQPRVIAPPTREIRSELEAASQVWSQIRPLMAPVIAGDEPDQEEILKVAELNLRLLEALNQALTLYRAL